VTFVNEGQSVRFAYNVDRSEQAHSRGCNVMLKQVVHLLNFETQIQVGDNIKMDF
jgi:hypothetical protein